MILVLPSHREYCDADCMICSPTVCMTEQFVTTKTTALGLHPQYASLSTISWRSVYMNSPWPYFLARASTICDIAQASQLMCTPALAVMRLSSAMAG